MKIFFGCTTTRFNEYGQYYYLLREYLVAQGHVMTHDWLPGVKEYIEKNKPIPHGTEETYAKVTKAIAKSDMLIFENSVSSFSIGHTLTLGLQHRTPILVLMLEDRPSFLKKSFIQGIKSDLLVIAEYNLENYKEIINSFIRKFERNDLKYRFNMILSEPEKRYLDWASFNERTNKTRIIKDLIKNKMDKDSLYTEYLKRL